MQGAKRGRSCGDATENARGSGELKFCGEDGKESILFTNFFSFLSLFRFSFNSCFSIFSRRSSERSSSPGNGHDDDGDDKDCCQVRDGVESEITGEAAKE